VIQSTLVCKAFSHQEVVEWSIIGRWRTCAQWYWF